MQTLTQRREVIEFQNFNELENSKQCFIFIYYNVATIQGTLVIVKASQFLVQNDRRPHFYSIVGDIG